MGIRLVGWRETGGNVVVGRLAEDRAGVVPICGLEEFWADPHHAVALPPTGPSLAVTDVDLVPPVLPGARVICVGLNYLAHLAEGAYAADGIPPHPTLFARWPASLTVDGAEIPVPPDEEGLDWEGEVVAYVGTALVDATPEEALGAVVGYSTFNDVTARRAQKLTSQWTLGKNADRSGPLGPLVPATEVGDLRRGLTIRTRVNGEVVQEASTDQMVYTVGDTLALISRTFALRAGDLLATGTPSGVGYARTPPRLMKPGDEVEVEVERLGTLRNTVVVRPGRAAQ
ncbi:fumarylacetoacetate hydrolase family protein [Streptomyces triticagri]|uniref:fumarylacetoacetate hydrolase family protein n=1 Tax=Streptomyces triticagri TaxID=2293568 RepID=UPI001F48F716|nr:fumarylacetoacetate hydrolase family protein [Streptomyces triticagri]